MSVSEARAEEQFGKESGALGAACSNGGTVFLEARRVLGGSSVRVGQRWRVNDPEVLRERIKVRRRVGFRLLAAPDDVAGLAPPEPSGGP